MSAGVGRISKVSRNDVDARSAIDEICPICGSADRTTYIDLGLVPVQANEFWPDEKSARSAPQARFELAVCRTCGLLSNPAFDPDLIDYGAQYEASLHFSPTFQEYVTGVAQHLAENRLEQGGTMVELGAGNGDFLVDVCRRAGASGIAFDPTYAAGADHRDGVDLRFVGSTREIGAVKADLVAARHVLEHVGDPADLLRMAAGITRAEGCLYIEVPDAGFTLDHGGIWDLIYPHVQYFTAPTLAFLANICGLDVQRCESTFKGQFLALEAVAGRDPEPQVPPVEHGHDVENRLARLAGHIDEEVARWVEFLTEQDAADRTVAVWGAGSKGVTFCHLVGNGLVSHVVDVNPRKQGRYLPCSGHEIVAPERLLEAPPSVVLVMNPNYAAEISGMLEQLDLSSEVIVVS